MGFVTDMSEWVSVPDGSGEFFMRPLSGGEYDECDLQGSQRIARTISAFAGIDPQLFADAAARDNVNPRATDPTAGLDKNAIVGYGLIAWRGGVYENVPCDDEHRELLDGATRDFAARWIASHSVRSENFDSGSTGNSPTTDGLNRNSEPRIESTEPEFRSPTPITGA
jgi:hypothetical protein